MTRYYNIICAKNEAKDITVYLPFNSNAVGILRYDFGIDITHEEFMLGCQLMFNDGSGIECEGGWVIYNPNDDQR